MWCGIVSLFPEIFQSLSYGITNRALKKKILHIEHYNPRDYTDDLHRTVDDRPYGGGPGMVMKVEPLLGAITAAKQKAKYKARVICMSPQGKKVTQSDIRQIAANEKNIIFVAGRYEGIDERVYDLAIDHEWSIGDYVLSGGELAILVIVDAITRLLPGALGHKCSAEKDSFEQSGLLDCPHYTRPEVVKGHKVPEVLLSGDHQAISNWRLQQQLGRTWLRRPDLLDEKELTSIESKLLKLFIERRGK